MTNLNSSLSSRLSRRGLLKGATGMALAGLLPDTLLAADAPVNPPTQLSRVRFRKVAINEASDYEVACAADVNGDGRMDIVSGDTWYEAPHWTPHTFREFGYWGRGPGESGWRKDF